MKRIYTVLLTLWMAACTAIPATRTPSTDALVSTPPTVTSLPALTPSPSINPSAQLPPTLIIPTLQSGHAVKLLSVQMVNEQTGWGIHEETREVLRPGFQGDFYLWPPEGYILRTVDGGKTWQNATPPTGAYSPAGFFALDANTAWASENFPCCIGVTATRVWRTSDGGRTWQASQPFQIMESRGEFYLPARMQFIDQNNGWLLASVEAGMGYSLREVLFRTADGGNTWENVNSFTEDLATCGNGGLAFIDSKTGWHGSSCVGRGKVAILFKTYFAEGGFHVRHTLDGGDTFSSDTIIPTPPDLQELAATNPELDCGENRVIAFTPEVVGIEWECIHYDDWTKYRYFSLSTDAGQTWNTWEPTGNEYFFSAPLGWRLHSPGQLQRTTDSGLNWTTLKTVAWEYAQFDFVSEEEGWAIVTNAGVTALVHTVDGGETWEEIKPVITSR